MKRAVVTAIVLANACIVLIIVGVTCRPQKSLPPIYRFTERDTWGSVSNTLGWALRTFFESMSGFHIVGKPAGAELEDALNSGDNVAKLRAFNDVLYHGTGTESAQRIFKSCLNDPRPYVRYLAARSLLVLGDNSGVTTLIDLLKFPSPIMALGGDDVRLNAVLDLGQYHQLAAIPAIYDFYHKTKKGDAFAALINLDPNHVMNQIPFTSFYPEANSIVDYALVSARQFLPQIAELFQKSNNTEVKAASAWALASMTDDSDAVSYLVDLSRKPQRNSSLSPSYAIRFLGALDDPRAKPALEEALDSDDASIVQTAIVNLLYNQGGSDKAVEVVAHQLNDPSHAKLQWEFTLTIAAQLQGDPRIDAAGAKFSGTDVTNDWRTYAVDRRYWSIYNWINGYVVDLKNTSLSDSSRRPNTNK
jgi:HEAT repeat protein